MVVRELELDLDAFEGPFDLLLTLLLKEELEPADVDMAAIVVAFVERLAEREELDLEACGEFLVLIAALLELKSRLMLPTEEDPELDLGPEEAAEELLARMLEYRRYKSAAAELAERFEAERPYLYRTAPLPPELRRVSVDAARAVYEPDRLGSALGDLLRIPPKLDTSHIRPTVSLERRLEVLRELLGGGRKLDFDEAFGAEDRLTQAVTIFALLELHKKGEATWSQSENFGPIQILGAAGESDEARGRERVSA
jgi:segregation and condensation protein A